MRSHLDNSPLNCQFCGEELQPSKYATKLFCNDLCRKMLKTAQRTGWNIRDIRRCQEAGVTIRSHFQLKEHWLSQEWSGYQIMDRPDLPPAWGPRTNLQLQVKHPNGHMKTVNFRSLYYGGLKEAPAPKSKWLGGRYGDLELVDRELPDYFYPGQKLSVWVKCKCGTETQKNWEYVNNGDTKTCGSCVAKNQHLFDVKSGPLTGVDRTPQSFHQYVKSLDPGAEYSVKGIIPHREIDVFLPHLKLAIEYHGNIWHSAAKRRPEELLKDYEKYQILQKVGIRSIQIYSDEWESKRSIFEALFRSIIINRRARRCKVEMRMVDHRVCNEFLSVHHYLGPQKGATYCVAAYYQKRVVGVWTFKKRTTKEIELTRIAWDHEYKAWNPHMQTLEFLKPELREAGFETIVTFSENRLHEGTLYQKLGFTMDKELSPDYMYTNGGSRVHKFRFRVPAGLKEEDEARKKGYFRIYDCGKKRWRLCLKKEN